MTYTSLPVTEQVLDRFSEILSVESQESLTLFFRANPGLARQFQQGEYILMSSTGDRDSWILAGKGLTLQEALISLNNAAQG